MGRRIDTRDLIDELEALEELEEDGIAEKDETARAQAIRDLGDEGISEWEDGAVLIPEDDFEEYARELAEDIGAWPSGEVTWPLTCIDWKWAASELRHDYTSVTFDGTDYLVRA